MKDLINPVFPLKLPGTQSVPGLLIEKFMDGRHLKLKIHYPNQCCLGRRGEDSKGQPRKECRNQHSERTWASQKHIPRAGSRKTFAWAVCTRGGRLAKGTSGRACESSVHSPAQWYCQGVQTRTHGPTMTPTRGTGDRRARAAGGHSPMGGSGRLPPAVT